MSDQQSTAAERLFGVAALLTAPLILGPGLMPAVPLTCLLCFGIARLLK